MIAKILYFNWTKANKEDGVYNPKGSLGRVRWTGELLVDRPDLYDHVGNIECAEAGETACGEAFRKFNRVEEGDMEGMNIRSMSVGDVVLFDDSRMFVVQGMGWKEIPTEAFFETAGKLAFWARPEVKEQSQ